MSSEDLEGGTDGVHREAGAAVERSLSASELAVGRDQPSDDPGALVQVLRVPVARQRLPFDGDGSGRLSRGRSAARAVRRRTRSPGRRGVTQT